MSRKIVIDPVTRIEGHLKIETILENGVVKEARASGMLWRGFETILQGRHPLDAQRITQRICGVCPTAHATASTLALESAFGIADQIPNNGRILRNLIAGSNYLQSHILHFYHLAALDYVDVTDVQSYGGSNPQLLQVQRFLEHGTLAPFVPRYEGDYRLSRTQNISATQHFVEALNIRTLAHEMLAIFGGHMPHNMAMVPGGVTTNVTVDNITDFRWRLEKIRAFIDHVYLPDVLAVAERYKDYFEVGIGCRNTLSFGSFDLDTNPDLTRRQRLMPQGRTMAGDLTLHLLDLDQITEHVEHSWYSSKSNLHPREGETLPARDKKKAYSWLKAPRYEGQVYEVGPLARQLNAYIQGYKPSVSLINTVLEKFNAGPEVLFSVLGRHAARAIEAKIIGNAMAQWVLDLSPGEPTHTPFTIPINSSGIGITDAPRGALGHWINIRDSKIHNYQAIVPTTWNGSPRDDNGQPGPLEQALENTRVNDAENPFELVRIVRSFDPCLACAIHTINPHGTEMGKFIIG